MNNIEDYENYWCERCCNFDREHVGMDAYAPCKFTGLPTFAETYAKDCRGFNVPSEQFELKSERIPCEKCGHFDRIMGRTLYGKCRRTNAQFLPFGIDTRTFSCTEAVPKCGTSGKAE